MSEVVSVLLLVAIVASLGVVVFIFATNGLGSVTQGFTGLMSNQGSAISERFDVEQAAFTIAGANGVGALALDGTASNQVAGASSSIAATLSTGSGSDVIMAYVSPADIGAVAPPSVSGMSGGGLTWYHRATTATETYTAYYYVPITLTNSQTGATPNPFQQKVTWNPSTYSTYEASNLGNIRFCTSTACTTMLYGWLESCTGACTTGATSASAWVRLTSSIAGSGGTLTIYMVFESTSTDFDGVYWGEAPNLSIPYGVNDNGASVFTQYGGASWSSFTPVEGTWDTTNGYLEQTATTGTYNGGPAALIEGTSYPANGAYIIDTAFSYTTQTTPRVGIITVTGLNAGDPVGYRFIGQQSNNGAGFLSFLNDRQAWVANNVYAGATGTSYTMEVADNSGTWSGTLYSGYGTTGASLTTLAPTAYTANNNVGSATGYVGVSAAYYNGGTVVGNPTQFQWFTMRAYPPSGVMPAVALGGTSSVSATFDLEEWYAVSVGVLSSATITATFAASDTASTWMAVFAVSGANTASPFDSNPSLPATSSGTTPSTTISTSTAKDMLLFGCAAGAGGTPSGFTAIFSNVYTDQNEYAAYKTVSTTQSGVAVSCGTNAYGAEIADALTTPPAGADLFVRNAGNAPITLVSVYIVDQSTNAFVAQFAISTTLNVGAVVDIPHSTLTFSPSHGHTYSFTVTSSRGNSVTFDSRAT